MVRSSNIILSAVSDYGWVMGWGAGGRGRGIVTQFHWERFYKEPALMATMHWFAPLWQSKASASESIEWFIEDQDFLPLYDLAAAPIPGPHFRFLFSFGDNVHVAGLLHFPRPQDLQKSYILWHLPLDVDIIMQMFIKWCFLHWYERRQKKLCFEIIKLKYINFISFKANIEEQRTLGLLVSIKKIRWPILSCKIHDVELYKHGA